MPGVHGSWAWRSRRSQPRCDCAIRAAKLERKIVEIDVETDHHVRGRSAEDAATAESWTKPRSRRVSRRRRAERSWSLPAEIRWRDAIILQNDLDRLSAPFARRRGCAAPAGSGGPRHGVMPGISEPTGFTPSSQDHHLGSRRFEMGRRDFRWESLRTERQERDRACPANDGRE